MNNELKIALLQIAPGDTLQENLDKGRTACRQAKSRGADIALFPEMWSNGYRLYDSPAEVWMQEAIPADGAFVQVFRSLARELDMAIGVTLLERWPGGPRNTLVLIDRRGKVRLTYAKVHTCDFSSEACLIPGSGFETSILDTAQTIVERDANIAPTITISPGYQFSVFINQDFALGEYLYE